MKNQITLVVLAIITCDFLANWLGSTDAHGWASADTIALILFVVYVVTHDPPRPKP